VPYKWSSIPLDDRPNPHCFYLAGYLSTMAQPSGGSDALVMTPPVSMLEVDDVGSCSHALKDLADCLSVRRWKMTFRKLPHKRQGQSSSYLDWPQFQRQFDSSSLTSSILEYEYENGRRYHAYKAGSYPLPNDEVCGIPPPTLACMPSSSCCIHV